MQHKLKPKKIFFLLLVLSFILKSTEPITATTISETVPNAGYPLELTLGEMGIADQLDFHLFCDAYDYNTGKYEFKEAKNCPSSFENEIMILNKVLNCIYPYLNIDMSNEGPNLQDIARQVFIGINHTDSTLNGDKYGSVRILNDDHTFFHPTTNPDGIKVELSAYYIGEPLFNHLNGINLRTSIDEYSDRDPLKLFLSEIAMIFAHELTHVYQFTTNPPNCSLYDFNIMDGLVSKDYIECAKVKAQIEEEAYLTARKSLPLDYQSTKNAAERVGYFEQGAIYTMKTLDFFLDEGREDLFRVYLYAGSRLPEMAWEITELNDSLESGEITLQRALNQKDRLNSEWRRYLAKIRTIDRNEIPHFNVYVQYPYLPLVKDRYEAELKRFKALTAKASDE
jgi:hypothetical protein